MPTNAHSGATTSQNNDLQIDVPEIHHRKPDLERPENEQLLDYWDRARGGAVLPPRSRFRPMDLPRHLPHIIMLEPDLPRQANIRIFGTQLSHRLGYDLTGVDMLSLYQAERADEVLEMLTYIAEEHLVTVASSTWTTPSGYTFNTENVWLPLAADDGSVTRILGSIWETAPIDADVVGLGDSVADAQSRAMRAFYRF